jgi:hypothetical protein
LTSAGDPYRSTTSCDGVEVLVVANWRPKLERSDGSG